MASYGYEFADDSPGLEMLDAFLDYLITEWVGDRKLLRDTIYDFCWDFEFGKKPMMLMRNKVTKQLIKSSFKIEGVEIEEIQVTSFV